ncbi:MAG: orotidine 5'-phosphate decarboxylase [Nitrospirae bacterium]|nr:orotidine 5'-phosphate decarboxylase [Nitrospirota bacterium]
MALLQVALDLLSIEQAIKVAEAAVDYVDIIEAGTPLIKSEGIRAVEALRENFEEKTIFADMKIMDAGALEARMAFEAGADIVSMCAQASIETITEAIGETRRWNKKAVVDLIGCRDWVLRAKELKHLPIDCFCLHTSLDEQTKGKRPFERLEGFVREMHLPYCIAGGIKPGDIPLIMPFGPSIIIVGGYITKAESPGDAARKVKEAIEKSKQI